MLWQAFYSEQLAVSFLFYHHLFAIIYFGFDNLLVQKLINIAAKKSKRSQAVRQLQASQQFSKIIWKQSHLQYQ